jgi:hypothetical protein
MFFLKNALIFGLFCVCEITFGAYVVTDEHGLGRRFDGIGGISGGTVSFLICKHYSVLITVFSTIFPDIFVYFVRAHAFSHHFRQRQNYSFHIANRKEVKY